MQIYRDGDSYVVVLKLGEELFESLTNFVKQNELKSAWFDGLGAAKEVELGYYRLDDKQYSWKTFVGPLEITGLHGNIVLKDCQPVFHAHGSFADGSYKVIGGHIKRLMVAGTCEILVSKLNLALTRKFDDEVGLELLETN